MPEQSLFNYKMDLVLCHAVLYIEEFLTVGCVIVMLLAKRKLVYHVFLHVSNKGKNTQQWARETQKVLSTVTRKSSGFLNTLGIFHPKWLKFPHFHFIFGHAMFHSSDWKFPRWWEFQSTWNTWRSCHCISNWELANFLCSLVVFLLELISSMHRISINLLE